MRQEHVASVEVSGREERSACPGQGLHPGRAVNGQRAGRALPWPRRKRQAGRAEEGQPGRGAGALRAGGFSSRQEQGEQLARGKH